MEVPAAGVPLRHSLSVLLSLIIQGRVSFSHRQKAVKSISQSKLKAVDLRIDENKFV